MNNLKRIGAIFSAAILVSSLMEIGLSDTYSLVASAQARVGRPLTPVSVAGVARRTTRRVVRRCAVGVYPCY
jgi:hypothetical protein